MHFRLEAIRVVKMKICYFIDILQRKSKSETMKQIIGKMDRSSRLSEMREKNEINKLKEK